VTRRLPLAVALLAAVPAAAFIRIRHPQNGAPARRTDVAAIQFRIHERTSPGQTNTAGQPTITSGSDPLGALQAAMNTWTGVPTSAAAFLTPLSTPDASPSPNGEHIITFADNAATRALAGDAVAVTVVTLTTTGEITDTDIVFHPGITFSTRNEPNTFDLQSIATHELGHALGASHSGLLAATMFHAILANSSIQARLSSDETAFLTAGALTNVGQISGSLRDLFGGPIFGALVTAIDTRTGVAVGGISEPDGSFTVSTLPPGEYFLHAEPADGVVTPSQLPPYFLSAATVFRTAVFGGPSSPATLAVTRGDTTTVNLTVLREAPFKNIDFAAVTRTGSGDLSGAVQGPHQVSAGTTFDLVVAGVGLDDTAIRESDVRILGAGLSILSGSIRRNEVINGRPAIRMTIQAAASAPYGTGTVLITGIEAVTMTAVLKIVPTGGAGGGGGGGGGPSPTGPALQVTPTSLRFTGPSGFQSLLLEGTAGLAWSAETSTSSGGNWLLLNAKSGTIPANIEVFAVAGDLEPGTYSGRITISVSNVTPVVVDASLVVAPPPAPLILETGVVSAASFVGGGVAPGEIVSILGVELGPRAGVVAVTDAAGSLPRSLRDVTVFIGGGEAPLLFVRHDQINAQAPYEVAGQAAVTVEVLYRGQKSRPVTVRVLAAKPGLFTTGAGAGAGQAAALNEDSSVNSTANPARQGSVIQLFLTGQGTVRPRVASGQRTPATAPFSEPERAVRVTIGGVNAPLQFAGLAPGLIGVLQVNVVVPAGVFPRENVPVLVTIGDAQGPTNVTVAVR